MNNLDIFKNYELQREELLARIAETLQLDTSRKNRMETAYRAISALINSDEYFFKFLEADVYPQGSVAIGTTVLPIRGSEFDLDIVLHIKKKYMHYTPTQIYNELLRVLESNETYNKKVEKKKRCIRINYANDFHMDIMPGCLVRDFDDNNIKVPDRELKDWTDSNPRGFIDWFLARCKTAIPSVLSNFRTQQINLRAEVEALPDDDFYTKSPLQRAVQLIKRYRDIYFEKDCTYATSSIVLTTLMGQYYQGENSIFNTLENVITRIRQEYQASVSTHNKFKILNPVNNQEDFTDKWTESHYIQFAAFIEEIFQKWSMLKRGFQDSSLDYIRLFGEGIYKNALQQQIKEMSRYSSDSISKANGLILNATALTNRAGQVNEHKGQKNESHSNFGG